MEDYFKDMIDRCKKCKKCNLSDTRNNVVWGYGNINSEIMFIGEAPGANEDEIGTPFVGRSGKLLDEMLNNIGLSRDKNIFISNIVKCRPPENRNPRTNEINTCIDWLYKQIEIINPKLIVCLGLVPSKKLIDRNIKITIDHGKFYDKNNILYTPFYHPSALLRNPNHKPISASDYESLQIKIKEVCNHTY